MGNNLNQIAKTLNTAKVGTLGNVEALKATTEAAALERSSSYGILAKEKQGTVPMIVQFFNREKGGGSGPIDLFWARPRREEAKLTRRPGKTALTAAITPRNTPPAAEL